jgi:hypothetical protein
VGAEDSELILRSCSAHGPRDQHPLKPAALLRTCPTPNLRGPQGDLWPPDQRRARTGRPAPPRSTAPPVAAHRGPRSTRGAKARDNTSPRLRGPFPGPCRAPRFLRRPAALSSPDFSLTAAPASRPQTRSPRWLVDENEVYG